MANLTFSALQKVSSTSMGSDSASTAFQGSRLIGIIHIYIYVYFIYIYIHTHRERERVLSRVQGLGSRAESNWGLLFKTCRVSRLFFVTLPKV